MNFTFTWTMQYRSTHVLIIIYKKLFIGMVFISHGEFSRPYIGYELGTIGNNLRHKAKILNWDPEFLMKFYVMIYMA